VVGSPSINVRRSKVDRKVPEIVGVGGPTQRICNLALAPQSRSSLTESTGNGVIGPSDNVHITSRAFERFLVWQNTRQMSDSEPSNVNITSGPDFYGNPCRECNFNWEISASDAVSLVEQLPNVYAIRLDGATGEETCPDLVWSVSAYVSHVSDNLRIWSERLAGARLSGESRVAGYDQDLLGLARRYEAINLRAALWSLDWAVQEWSSSIRVALVAGTELQHSDRGRQSAEDVARNNAHDASHHLWDIERIIDANE
jgi:hypothetical protein